MVSVVSDIFFSFVSERASVFEILIRKFFSWVPSMPRAMLGIILDFWASTVLCMTKFISSPAVTSYLFSWRISHAESVSMHRVEGCLVVDNC